MSEATEKTYDEVVMVEKMPVTWATSFAEYDAEEAAEEAIEEIQDLTKLFNVMIENIMFNYSVEDRVGAIQVLADEYKVRITEWMKVGGIKTFDDSAWSDDADKWETAEAYCKDCLFDFNAKGEEKTKALGLLPYRRDGGAPNKSALQDIATSLKAVERPKSVSQAVFDVKKQQAAIKMLGWWPEAFGQQAPESLYEVAGKSRPVEEVQEPAVDNGLKQLKVWIDEIKSFLLGTKSLDVYQSGVRLTKGTDGKPWILLWSTNAFIDREKEIFTTKSIDDFIERHTEDDIKGEVWFYHLPGSKFADIKMQARVGRFLLEAAPFDDTEMGQAFEKFFQENPEGHSVLAPNGWGQSHGYKFMRKDRVDGIYTAFEKHESTILPWDIASNQHNPRPMFTTEDNLMNDKQRAAFEGVFGTDLVEQMVAQGETKTAELEATGVAYKAVEDVKVTEEAAKEEKEVVAEAEVTPEVEVVAEAEVVPETKETETEEKEVEVVEPVSREEIAAGLKVFAEEMAVQFEKMVEGKVSAAIDELIEVVVPLAKRVNALSETEETKIAKSVSETPTSSLAALIQSSIVGTKETLVDGRTSLAKDSPVEETKAANGPNVAGVNLNLWN